jgi:hypothetical protein
VAIYHLSAQIISRKSGRSSTAAAAYRAGVEITDQRTGEVHDYTRKRGIESADIVMPSGSTWSPTRVELWNTVEAKNKRADAQVAREFLVALPDELDAGQRRRLAVDFAQELADRYGIAADVAIHAPGKEGDQRNHHAHILTTTNRVEGDGFGNKVRELDLVAHNMGGGVGKANEIDHIRARWAELANERLREHGHEARIDHRTLEAQGIDREPTRHLGPTATAIERRTGQASRKRQDFDQDIAERLERAKAAGELERQSQALERSILDLSGNLEAAKTTRIQEQAAELLKRATERSEAEAGAKYARALENVTSETLATVPGLLPAQAIKRALHQVGKEVEAEAGQAPAVDVDAIRRQVLAQPAMQQRLSQAALLEARGQATLADVAGMGSLKRLMYDTKAMTEEAHQLLAAAKLERAQVGNAVELSPEVQAALKADELAKRTRLRTVEAIKELDQVLTRTERGQAPHQRQEHIYRVPETVTRVVDRARAIAPTTLQGMQLAEVERMTAKAVDVEWKAPASQREFDVRVSRFVLPAAERRQQQEKEQARQQQQGHGHSR